MTTNKSEAQANPAPSGAGTTPQQIMNPPDRVPAPGTVQGDGRSIQAADFSFETDPDPRKGPVDGGNDRLNRFKQEENPQGPTAAQMVRIKFDGVEEDIPLDKAATMIQQYKSINKNSGPLLELGNQIRAQTGITDPQQIAQLVTMALNNMQSGQSKQQAVDGAVAAAQAGGDVPAVPSDPKVANERAQKAEASVRSFFEKQGLNPDPADPVYLAMVKMVTYGDAVEGLAQSFPKVADRVQAFEQEAATRVQQAKLAQVDAQALKTAEELGINSEENLAQFQAYVSEMEQMFPGYAGRVLENPQAMDKAIRSFHAQAVGTKALATGKMTTQNAIKDMARAGGEGVAARGAPGAGPASDRMSFNDKMLTEL